VLSGRRLDAWRHAASQDGESIRPRPIP
jgi:hypothetical protein